MSSGDRPILSSLVGMVPGAEPVPRRAGALGPEKLLLCVLSARDQRGPPSRGTGSQEQRPPECRLRHRNASIPSLLNARGRASGSEMGPRLGSVREGLHQDDCQEVLFPESGPPESVGHIQVPGPCCLENAFAWAPLWGSNPRTALPVGQVVRCSPREAGAACPVG